MPQAVRPILFLAECSRHGLSSRLHATMHGIMWYRVAICADYRPENPNKASVPSATSTAELPWRRKISSSPFMPRLSSYP